MTPPPPSRLSDSEDVKEYATDEPTPYDPNDTDLEAYNGERNMAKSLSRAMSTRSTASKIEELTKQLSRRTHDQGSFQLDNQDVDLEVVLKSFREKMDDNGLSRNYTGVSFTDLCVTAPEVGSTVQASMTEVFLGLVSLPSKFSKKTNPRKILHSFDGLIKAGEMCLVLGRPGAGCSSLLKTLAGEIDEFTQVSGELHYEGASQKEMLKHFKNEVIYNGELDVHFPHLTVEQTLRFAIACRTPRTRLPNVTRAQFEEDQLTLLTTVFGLRHTLKTKVGSDYVRGVSGGERKRVSIAEALASRASLYCWDNATRGLDASTALEYAHAIRAATNYLDNVGVVAIYQAGENIFEVFDKVTVIYSGRQVYFGPAKDAVKYFTTMGYARAPRQTSAEFLTAVTDPNGRTLREDMDGKYVPQTAEEFEKYWKSSPDHEALMNQIKEYNEKSNGKSTLDRFVTVKKESQMKHTRHHSRYLLSYPAQLRLNVIRGFQRIVGNFSFTLTTIVGSIIQALVMGSLFYDLTPLTSGSFSRGGVLFFAILFNSLTALSEVGISFENRPILMKHKSYSFYHPSTEALQGVLAAIPVKASIIMAFSIILYFLSRLYQSAGQFFLFTLITFFTTLAVGAFFQMLAATQKSSDIANSLAGIGVLLIVVYTGYVIPTSSMHPWFRWINWLDPSAYGFEALMANEFHGRKMDCNAVVPSGPGYVQSPQNQACAFTGARTGSLVVDGNDYLEAAFSYRWSHFWRNFGILVGFWIFFSAINAVFTEVLRAEVGGADTLIFKRGVKITPEEAEEAKEEEADADTSMEAVDLGTRDIFSWQHVCYSIPLKEGTRVLLEDVQGYVKPGTLTALMGESGAGKTTLLNVLSQRISSGTISGDFLINGQPLDDTFQRRTGYVQQQDLHLAESTVRESLMFAARLRQPASVPDSEKEAYVTEIIKLLGMTKYADAVVGRTGHGLNVEQRKKLSIGVELVAKPSLLLFLDEPTSGLDSQSAWAIVAFLRQLAQSGQAILCTIHQPSATLFEQFDRLLLLKKGGKTVYYGDIGKQSSVMIKYFQDQGARKCSPEENPAEYILECIGAGATATVTEDWYDIWCRSREYEAVTNEVTELKNNPPVQSKDLSHTELGSKFAVGWFTQLKWVYFRTAKLYWRSPTYIMAKFSLMALGGLFIGFTFWKIDHSLAGMQNLMFAIFLSLVLASPLTNQIQEFAVPGRELYEVRESQSNTYHWSVMLLSQFFSELPYHFVCSTIMYLCIYFTVGFNAQSDRAGYFYLIFCVIFQIYYVSFALLVVYASPDAASASMINSVMFSFKISFCGVLQPVSLMPNFWTFMYKVSPYTYFIQSLLGSVAHERAIQCKPAEYTIIPSTVNGVDCQTYMGPFMSVAGGYLSNPEATSNCSYCSYNVGDQYLASVNIKYSYRWRNFGFFWAYILFNVVALLLCYYLFRVMSWKNLLDFKKKKSHREIREKPSEESKMALNE